MRVGTMIGIGALAVAMAGCGKKPPALPAAQTSPPPPVGGGVAGVKPPFLEGTREIPSRQEWTRDFGSRAGGPVRFRVSSTGPFSVTIITDKGYKALTGGGKVDRGDVLLTADAKPPTYEGRLTVPPGMSWFIIENQSEVAAMMKLECFDGD